MRVPGRLQQQTDTTAATKNLQHLTPLKFQSQRKQNTPLPLHTLYTLNSSYLWALNSYPPTERSSRCHVIALVMNCLVMM